MTESNLKSKRGNSAKVKRQKSTLPRSFEEAVQIWEKAKIKSPESIEDLVEKGFEFDGGGDDLSADCKTSEGLNDFVKVVDGFHIHVQIPFKSVRTYGKPVIHRVWLPIDDDAIGVALVHFLDGKPTAAKIHDERGEPTMLPTSGTQADGIKER
jgi:hypothetical protein